MPITTPRDAPHIARGFVKETKKVNWAWCEKGTGEGRRSGFSIRHLLRT